jgi:WD40 repeat protein
LLVELKSEPKIKNWVFIKLKDGHLAVGWYNPSIMIWNYTSGMCIRNMTGQEEKYVDLVSLNVKTLISCSRDRTIKMWNTSSGELLKSFTDNLKWGFTRMTLLNDRTVASADWAGVIFIWDIEQGLKMDSLYGHIDSVTSLIYLENYYFASGSLDNAVEIWNYETGEEVKVNLAHDSRINSLVLLRNGHLASAGEDVLKIWNYTSGQLVDTIRGNFKNLNLLENGNLVCLASNGYIQMWHTNNQYNSSKSMNESLKFSFKLILLKLKWILNYL